MNAISIVVLISFIIGAADYLIGNKFGLGKEFEKGFALFCPMALSMLGMIVLAPALGVWLAPVFEWFYNIFGIDPSIIPASILANDMGGTSLAQAIYKSPDIGKYNAFIISSMMGCVISFTLPFSISTVSKSRHKELFIGLLCGIITIPIGSFVSGLICKINPFAILINLLPLIILSVIIAVGLIFFQKICIKCFAIFGLFMKSLAIIGLLCAVFTFLTKIKITPHFDSLENAAFICVNACITLAGALPMMFIVSKLLNKPLNRLSSKMGINSVSAITLLSTTVTSTLTFGVMDKMDKKGIVLNSAFAVSAGFTFGGHLAFTMAFDSSYILPMIVGKLISGLCAVILAVWFYKEDKTKTA
ncbi:MAG: ethanolamine utilization protein EutH [Clostridia bacterium]|nr:ethanolamine utilization protein EutH [Clostridia bacterium]